MTAKRDRSRELRSAPTDAERALWRALRLTMSAGTLDPTYHVIKFWRGTFTGYDSEGHAYNGINEPDTNPELIATSPEFANIQTVIDWCNVNFDFNNNIKLVSSLVEGSGFVSAADLASTSGNQLFAGGTQVYDTARVSEALEAVKKLDYTFVYSLDGGADAQSADNGKILAHIHSEARFEKFLVVGGGDSRDGSVFGGAKYGQCDGSNPQQRWRVERLRRSNLSVKCCRTMTVTLHTELPYCATREVSWGAQLGLHLVDSYN